MPRFPTPPQTPYRAAFDVLRILIEGSALTIVFDKLGLLPVSALVFLCTAIIGSLLDLPLLRVKTSRSRFNELPVAVRDALLRTRTFSPATTIKLNVGGGLVPLVFAIQLSVHYPVKPVHLLLVVLVFSLALEARRLPMVAMLRLAVPILAAVGAAVLSRRLDPANSVALAYVSGTIGTMIGAQLLPYYDVRNLGLPSVTIGADGLADGMFVNGLLAALLA